MKEKIISTVYVTFTSILIFAQLLCFWLYYWHEVLKHPVIFDDLVTYGGSLVMIIALALFLVALLILLDFVLFIRSKKFHYEKALILATTPALVFLLQNFSNPGAWYLDVWAD